MNKVKVYCTWELPINMEFEKEVNIFVDFHQFNPNAHNDAIKILMLIEPEEIMRLTQITIKNQHLFDYILTHNEAVLNCCPNARLFEFGGTWIKNYDFPEKGFSVSTLVGGKLLAPGHYLRHGIWHRQDDIDIAKRFFLSSNFKWNIDNPKGWPMLGEKKDILFESQFHIAIENAKRKYWFTEKLIDCFQTKTIPIYWGCPNIGDYFNLNGMYLVENVKDMIKVCNSLTPETYNEKIKYVEENYEKSKSFINIAERLEKKLIELIK